MVLGRLLVFFGLVRVEVYLACVGFIFIYGVSVIFFYDILGYWGRVGILRFGGFFVLGVF